MVILKTAKHFKTKLTVLISKMVFTISLDINKLIKD